MPSLRKQFWLCLAGLLLPGLAMAAYITDNIELEVFSQPFNQGAILTTINSGEQVEVLNSDGDYARITTASNITGWIEARFLSDKTNARVELTALQDKLHSLEEELRHSREQLVAAKSGGVSDQELKKLQQAAKDVGWLRAELKKARGRVKELENAAKARAASSNDAQTELETLRAENADLEKRLGAVLLVNGEAEGLQAAETDSTAVGDASDVALDSATPAEEPGLQLKLEWFLGSLVSAIIVGIILGMVWLDRRMRKRHGGFRLY